MAGHVSCDLHAVGLEKWPRTGPFRFDEAFGVGLATWRHLQQALRYALYGVAINFLSEKVFTPRDLYASDAVKKHLGLTGPNDGKFILDM